MCLVSLTLFHKGQFSLSIGLSSAIFILVTGKQLHSFGGWISQAFKAKLRGLCSGSQPEASAGPNLQGSPTPIFTHGTPRSNGPLCCFQRFNFLHLHEILSCVVPA